MFNTLKHSVENYWLKNVNWTVNPDRINDRQTQWKQTNQVLHHYKGSSATWLLYLFSKCPQSSTGHVHTATPKHSRATKLGKVGLVRSVLINKCAGIEALFLPESHWSVFPACWCENEPSRLKWTHLWDKLQWARCSSAPSLRGFVQCCTAVM